MTQSWRSKPIAAIVIDEAHEATARSYDDLFRLGKETIIIGLSATPGHADPRLNRKLVGRFQNRILRSQELGNEPVPVLQRGGYLANIDSELIATHYRLDSDFTQDESGQLDYRRQVLEAAGRSVTRNQKILDYLQGVDDERSVLVFTSSVSSARALATALVLRGRRAAAVDASSQPAARAELVRAFREKRLQFLLNFGIFTTGFDAPKVDVLVMARPTLSPVLLEQMLGRGLRGPRNGGTKQCTIAWISDLGDGGAHEALGYARFLAGWK